MWELTVRTSLCAPMIALVLSCICVNKRIIQSQFLLSSTSKLSDAARDHLRILHIAVHNID